MEYSFDDDYLHALRARDPKAEQHLVSSLVPQVKRSVRKRLRSSELAEDALQETFLRVLVYFRAGKTLRAAGSLPGFVNAVSTFVALEMLREPALGTSAEHESAPADSATNPEHAVAWEEQRRIVRRALDRLDPKDALLLRRVFLEDAERDQLCREMQISQAYLRVMVHRAKQRLKDAVLRLQPRVKCDEPA